MSVNARYQWGYASRLRAHRDWLRVSKDEMAARMSAASGLPLSRRSYQRMESGEAAIHESIWETVAELVACKDAFDREVDEQVARLLAEIPEDASEFVIHIDDDAGLETREVVARAMHADGRVLPKSPEDELAEQEMTG